ncbi:MAG: type II secretion system protein, partial [Ilumatobacteraceae bacterium]
MTRYCDPTRRDESGFTLIEILIAIVLVGVLSAVAVVGISNLVSKSANAACTASADAARAASAVYLTSHAAYPVDLAALTTPTGTGATLIPAALTMPTGVTVSGAVATSAGGRWTLTMTPGSVAVAPTFACATTAAATTTTMTTMTTVPVTVPAADCPGRLRLGRSGWRGVYFGTVDLSGPRLLCRDDAAIDFDWRDGPPSD